MTATRRTPTASQSQPNPMESHMITTPRRAGLRCNLPFLSPTVMLLPHRVAQAEVASSPNRKQPTACLLDPVKVALTGSAWGRADPRHNSPSATLLQNRGLDSDFTEDLDHFFSCID